MGHEYGLVSHVLTELMHPKSGALMLLLKGGGGGGGGGGHNTPH